MLKIYNENRFFFIPYLIVLLLSTSVLFFADKAEIHIFMNKIHSPFGDLFFRNITHLGEWIGIVAVIIYALFVKYRYTISAIFGIGISTIIVYTTKQSLKMPRPKKFFNQIYEGDYVLRLVENIDVHSGLSFPSGHTATAFLVFTLFAVLTPQKHNWLKITFLALAILVAYSRVYLSQHFFQDVIAGSIVGILAAVLGIYFSKKIKIKSLDKSLKSLFI